MYMAERYAHENGRDYAMRMLKENIIRLELEPGAAISDRELAAQLGLSRTPVREALLDLAKVKIVEIFPQRGSLVALVDYALVEEASFVRSALETAVVELVCSVISRPQLKELEDHVKLQRYYQQQDEWEKLHELDDDFHRLLFQIARKMQAYDMMHSLTIHFDRVRSMALRTSKEQRWIEDHERLVEAIRDNDPGLAHRLMDEHLRRYKVDEQAVRERYPQYFTMKAQESSPSGRR